MAGAKKGSWIGATVFGSVVIVVASWFLAINPTLSAASEVKAQTEQVKSQNDALAVKVAKLNIDENPELAAQFGVRSIPTLMMFKGGEVADIKVGAAPKTALSHWIGAAVA